MNTGTASMMHWDLISNPLYYLDNLSSDASGKRFVHFV